MIFICDTQYSDIRCHIIPLKELTDFSYHRCIIPKDGSRSDP